MTFFDFHSANHSTVLKILLPLCLVLSIYLLSYLGFLPTLYAVYFMLFVCAACYLMMVLRPHSSFGQWWLSVVSLPTGVWDWCLQCSFVVDKTLPSSNESKPPQAESTLEKALFFLQETQHRDVSKALNILMKLAHDGNVLAMYHLALCYRDAIGVEYSLSNALHWLQAAINIDGQKLYVDEFTRLQARYLLHLEAMAIKGCNESLYLLGCYYRYECSLGDKKKLRILARDCFKKASDGELSRQQQNQDPGKISYLLRASKQYVLCCYDDALYDECISIGLILLDKGLHEVLNIVVISLLRENNGIDQANKLVRNEMTKGNPYALGTLQQLQQNHFLASTFNPKSLASYAVRTPLKGFRPQQEWHAQSPSSEGSQSPSSEGSQSPSTPFMTP